MNRLLAVAAIALSACSSLHVPRGARYRDWRAPAERHFRRVTRLTFGGTNAEAYFSRDGRMLVFQSTRDGRDADQIYLMEPDGTHVTMASTGTGRATCGYFLGDGRFLYSSTHLTGPDAPPKPDRSEGYAWPVYDQYDIFLVNPYDSTMTQLTDNPGYDAEATVHWPTDRIVFTSLREGDLDLYSMRPDGRDVRRLTTRLGYEGGAFFSPDGSKIVYRAYYPTTPEEEQRYRELLERRLVAPPSLEIYLADADGSDPVAVTHAGGASFAPSWHPDGRRIIFSSNLHTPDRHDNYELYLVNADGTGLERITDSPGFDGFPIFSPDGRSLIFASKRGDPHAHDIDLYLAEWVD